MVPLKTGTLIRFFFASSTPLAIAVVTSLAFPKPYPTIPFSLPTTTIAAKLKWRPPLVTLVTLLMDTRRSFNSRSVVFTFSNA